MRNLAKEYLEALPELASFWFTGNTLYFWETTLWWARFSNSSKVTTLLSHQSMLLIKSRLFHDSRFIYPTIVSAIIATLYFPPVLGKYLMSTTTSQQTTMALFANFSWLASDLSENDKKLLSPWNTQGSVFVTLGIYMAGTASIKLLIQATWKMTYSQCFCSSFYRSSRRQCPSQTEASSQYLV